MGTTLNRHAYQRLIDEDLEWLLKQPRTLESYHIEAIVRRSPELEYGLIDREFANQQQRVEERCVNCGHPGEDVDPEGYCVGPTMDGGGNIVPCGHRCIFPSAESEAVYDGAGGGKNVVFAAFETASSHSELADLVWASRALIDGDADDAPFFTFEALARDALWGDCLGLYFKHAERILGRSPLPVEVDEIDCRSAEAYRPNAKAEGLERGRRVLRERFPELLLQAKESVQSAGERIEALIQQWRAALQDGSHVTDEDAEDLMFRLLAKRGNPIRQGSEP